MADLREAAQHFMGTADWFNDILSRFSMNGIDITVTAFGKSFIINLKVPK